MVKNACNVGNLGLILELGRFPGEGSGYPLQYSCLENSMGRGAWLGLTFFFFFLPLGASTVNCFG